MTDIYLYIDRKNVPPKAYARFIKEAAKNGIRVEALGGDPTWGLKENREHIQAFIEWVKSYNFNAHENERFSGVHLDIEPYLLPEWENNQNDTLVEWLSNMDFVAREVKSLGHMEVTLDLPFWINKIEIPGYHDYYLGTWILKRFNTIALMDYRNYAQGDDGIVANALAVVKEASSMGKSVIVGVEMGNSNEGGKTTFYEKGYRKMEEELEIAQKELGKHGGFRGFAIHGFPAWVASYQETVLPGSS
ncbi:hypothetical protein NDK47_19775 [Brevibacillus ruminantium]|uniref:Uncharacterized protein n=1 Tax=Brevibacillus ruminantium TaxID=2950604 RepID=A0ABY4WIB6_9BACL|nr:hypothetical protein [Brevibacillus ruminantium]USG64376.1 hypothetical protein NDK47_19775 [Brevibacillus ruminantium]